MKTENMIQIALIAINKNYNYETLKYSDYMYGNEEFTDDVYNYVEDCKNIGLVAWKEKHNL